MKNPTSTELLNSELAYVGCDVEIGRIPCGLVKYQGEDAEECEKMKKYQKGRFYIIKDDIGKSELFDDKEGKVKIKIVDGKKDNEIYFIIHTKDVHVSIFEEFMKYDNFNDIPVSTKYAYYKMQGYSDDYIQGILDE